MPNCRRSAPRSQSLASIPSYRRRPRSGSSEPASRRSSVVFPLPDGPRITIDSPSFMETLNSLSTCGPPGCRNARSSQLILPRNGCRNAFRRATGSGGSATISATRSRWVRVRYSCRPAANSSTVAAIRVARRLRNAKSTPNVNCPSSTPPMPAARNRAYSITVTTPWPVPVMIASFCLRVSALIAVAKPCCQCARRCAPRPIAFTAG